MAGLRVVFMGTPAFAVPTLMEIIGQGHEVRAVYTRAPAQTGRGLQVSRSPVHEAAARFGIETRHPRTLRDPDEQARFAALEADVAVVVAYGLLLPRAVLEAPELGCLNLHASLLPRWRGAAPIHRAIMAGDVETGAAVMRMEEGLDTGPVAMVERLAIGADATTGEVHDALSRLGADLMGRALAALSRGSLAFVPQPDEGVTYARKIDNAEARIDWTQAARTVHDHIRGLSPAPGAFALLDSGKGPERLRILRSRRRPPGSLPAMAGEVRAGPDGTLLAAAADGWIELVEVQRAGGKAMSGADFLRGLGPLPAGLAFA